MLQAIRKLFNKGTNKSEDTMTIAPTPSPNPNGTTNTATNTTAESEAATEAEVTTPSSNEPTVVETVSPPPLPALCQEPKELNLYEPSEKEAQFANWLEDRIIGQPKAVKALVSAYRAYLNPIRNPNKPINTLMFLGPSRTGKTLCAQRLAEYFHGRRDAYIKVDGGDYMDRANLTKLFGASAQWVGYQKPNEKIPEGMMDTSALLSAHNLIASRKGSSANVTVVLVDEVEKGCLEFLQFFLAILDVASATMGNNQKVDYSNCIFIMTSNLGMDRVEKELSTPIGLGATQVETLSDSRIKTLVEKCMKERFLPEFRNRIDMSVIFSHLTDENIRKIVDVEITDLQKQMSDTLAANKFEIEIDNTAREFILNEALKGKGNVANLKRVLDTHLSSPLGTGLINGTIGTGQTVSVTSTGSDRLSFYVSDSPTNVTVQVIPVAPKELVEAEKLWEQASKDYNANLIDLAISNLRKSIEVLEPLGSSQGLRLAQLYNRLGLYYSKKPDREQEVSAYLNALKQRLQATTADNISELTELPTIYGNLGVTYSLMREQDKAKAVFEEGMEHCKKYAQAYKGSGNLSYFLWRYAEFDCAKTKELFQWALAWNVKT